MSSETSSETVRIYRKPAGPIRVEGLVNLTDADGNALPHPPAFSLCGCGQSQKMPFCDASHKTLTENI